MMIRVLMGILPMTVGALIYSGALPVASLLTGGSYSADIAAPRDHVVSALSDLDLDEITKSGSVPYASSLKHKRTPEGMVWTLMADGKAMLEMVATLTPSSDGASTYVAAETRKGPDYDERKLATGLQDMTLINTVFSAALEMELNEFAPPAERKTEQQLKEDRMAIVLHATTAKMMANPMAIAVEARRREVEFKDQMAEAEAQQASYAEQEKLRAANAGVTFEPGKPMVDVSKH
jgi:hypothetical protein